MDSRCGGRCDLWYEPVQRLQHQLQHLQRRRRDTPHAGPRVQHGAAWRQLGGRAAGQRRSARPRLGGPPPRVPRPVPQPQHCRDPGRAPGRGGHRGVRRGRAPMVQQDRHARQHRQAARPAPDRRLLRAARRQLRHERHNELGGICGRSRLQHQESLLPGPQPRGLEQAVVQLSGTRHAVAPVQQGWARPSRFCRTLLPDRTHCIGTATARIPGFSFVQSALLFLDRCTTRTTWGCSRRPWTPIPPRSRSNS